MLCWAIFTQFNSRYEEYFFAWQKHNMEINKLITSKDHFLQGCSLIYTLFWHSEKKCPFFFFKIYRLGSSNSISKLWLQSLTSFYLKVIMQCSIRQQQSLLYVLTNEIRFFNFFVIEISFPKNLWIFYSVLRTLLILSLQPDFFEDPQNKTSHQPRDHLKIAVENGLKRITEHLESEPLDQLCHWEFFQRII